MCTKLAFGWLRLIYNGFKNSSTTFLTIWWYLSVGDRDTTSLFSRVKTALSLPLTERAIARRSDIEANLPLAFRFLVHSTDNCSCRLASEQGTVPKLNNLRSSKLH